MMSSVGLGPFATEAVKKIVSDSSGRMIVDLLEGTSKLEFEFTRDWFERNAVIIVSTDLGDVTLTLNDEISVPGKDFSHVSIMNIGPGKVTIIGNMLVPEAGRNMSKSGYGMMEVYSIFENPILVTGGDIKPEPPSAE